MSQKPTKSDLKAAQAKHLADLFGDDAPQAGESQRAKDQQVARGTKLTQAAAAKQRQLPDDEAAKLTELRQKAKPAQPAVAANHAATESRPTDIDPTASEPDSAPTDSATTAPRSGLHQLSDSNDLADAALRNMQAHIREQRQPSASAVPPTTSPVQDPAPSSRPSTEAAAAPAPPPTQPLSQPAASAADQDPATQSATPPPRPPRPKRPAPSPEELDRLLKAMAARSRRARARQGTAPTPSAPGYAGSAEAAPDATPQMEAPPDIPEEAPERNQEKQAEILKGLQDREATAQQQAPQIPLGDQPRAAVEPVEVKVPIVTDDNAVSAAPLHEALADLATQMGAKNAPGQVAGANRVQRNMPGHPLYDPDRPASPIDQGGQRG